MHATGRLPMPHCRPAGDTLFALGCGRMFEGHPEMMWASLSKLTALPPETQVYCAHEYTQACCGAQRSAAVGCRSRSVPAGSPAGSTCCSRAVVPAEMLPHVLVLVGFVVFFNPMLGHASNS